MPDVGDLATASLTVEPFDGTTSATLTAYVPDGTSLEVTVHSDDDGHTWSGPVTYTVPGVWVLAWTVTGTGASVEREPVSVAPFPLAEADSRSYATSTDLANYLRAAAPLDAGKLLADASRFLDAQLLRVCRYDVDDDGMPTNATVVAALRDAVCAQVEWWDEVGDSTGAAGVGWASVSIGSASLSRSAASVKGNDSPARQLAPKAIAALNSPELTSDIFRMGAVTSVE